MSVQLFLLDKMFRFTMKRGLRKNPDVLSLRPVMERMTRAGRSLPRHVRVRSTVVGRVGAERLETDGADSSRAILYVHGGGMVAGSPLTHRAITWRLADQVAVPVVAVDYRLAPEHPFPAGLDDVVDAYRALLDSGVAPSKIVVAGDSAGGNLTLATALKLKMLDIAMPAALVCLSPATDLSGKLESRDANMHSDAVFDRKVFESLMPRYAPGADVSEPLISPLHGDLNGLPPTLFHCGEGEMLRDDSILMAKKMKTAGVDVTLEVWPDVFHVWHLAADVLPEGRRALRRVAAFMKARLGVESAVSDATSP